MSDAIKTAIEALDDVRSLLATMRHEPRPAAEIEIEVTRCRRASEALAALKAVPPAPAVPPGWKLVPVEPTTEMVAAGWIDKEDVNPDDIYRAMIDAAPKQET